jgi:EAL domain-containing protein (putative c-di-GMP-specific phosphodiesterase class I)
MDATTDPDDAALVKAIITLSHNLRLKVIAEGVETEEQLRFLQLLRCDEIQGDLFSRPVPAETLLALMESQNDRLSNLSFQKQRT